MLNSLESRTIAQHLNRYLHTSAPEYRLKSPLNRFCTASPVHTQQAGTQQAISTPDHTPPEHTHSATAGDHSAHSITAATKPPARATEHAPVGTTAHDSRHHSARHHTTKKNQRWAGVV